jgi:hypothetical protein
MPGRRRPQRRRYPVAGQTVYPTIDLRTTVFFELLRSSPDVGQRVAVTLAQRQASDRYTLIPDPTDPGVA